MPVRFDRKAPRLPVPPRERAGFASPRSPRATRWSCGRSRPRRVTPSSRGSRSNRRSVPGARAPLPAPFRGNEGYYAPRGPATRPRVRPKPATGEDAAPQAAETEIGLDGRPLDAEASTTTTTYGRTEPRPNLRFELDGARSTRRCPPHRDRDELAGCDLRVLRRILEPMRDVRGR